MEESNDFISRNYARIDHLNRYKDSKYDEYRKVLLNEALEKDKKNKENYIEKENYTPVVINHHSLSATLPLPHSSSLPVLKSKKHSPLKVPHYDYNVCESLPTLSEKKKQQSLRQHSFKKHSIKQHTPKQHSLKQHSLKQHSLPVFSCSSSLPSISSATSSSSSSSRSCLSFTFPPPSLPSTNNHSLPSLSDASEEV